MQSYGGPDQNHHLHKTDQRAAAVFAHPATHHPWLLDGMPWMLATTNAPQPGGIMQFGANAYNVETEPQCAKWQQKRKSFEQLASGLPPKQLITEERITAHFSGLRISGDANGVGSGRSPGHHHHNNNSVTTTVNGGLATDDIPSTSTGKTHHPNPAYQMAAMELEQKLRNANRIVICDELKQNVSPVTAVGSIPPEWLLKSIPRPCTALVPWQPSPLQLTGVHHTLAKDAATTQDRLRHSAIPTVGGGRPGGSAGGAGPGGAGAGGVDLDDYDDDLQFFENNNTCNVNLNKSDEQMDEDL